MLKTLFLFLPLFLSGSFLSEEPQKAENPNNVEKVYTYCEEGDNEDSQPMLSGTVRDSSNNLLYHACVEIRTTGGALVAIIGTDANGHYFFNTVTVGTYDLRVSYPGFTPKITPISVTTTPQTVNVTLN